MYQTAQEIWSVLNGNVATTSQVVEELGALRVN
jgi:hypothetical protein